MMTEDYLVPEANPVVREDLERITAADLPWEQLRDKTILVTGGGGFLAAYMIKSLLCASRRYGLNAHVICVARSHNSVERRLASCIGAADFSIVEHDIAQPLHAGFPSADIIVHAASQASPKYYGVDPVGTLMANSAGTHYLLQHAIASGCGKFVFFSSGEVYGIPRDGARQLDEQDYGYLDPMNVRSCYAESKRIGETMCVAWGQQYGIHTSVIRPFHTYGPGIALDDGRVFADFVADVVAKRDIVLKSDGLAQRPFCYIADATVGFLTVLLKGGNGQAYNVGNPAAEISIAELAQVVAGLFPERGVGVRFEVPAASSSYLQSPVARSCPDVTKIRGLGWVPGTGVDHGFHRTIASFLDSE